LEFKFGKPLQPSYGPLVTSRKYMSFREPNGTMKCTVGTGKVELQSVLEMKGRFCEKLGEDLSPPCKIGIE